MILTATVASALPSYENVAMLPSPWVILLPTFVAYDEVPTKLGAVIVPVAVISPTPVMFDAVVPNSIESVPNIKESNGIFDAVTLVSFEPSPWNEPLNDPDPPVATPLPVLNDSNTESAAIP